jgi:hypothetical protein
MIRTHQAFWQLSPRGRADEGPESERSIISDNVPVELELPLESGRPIADPKKKLKARLKGRVPLEDVPWCDCFSPIVSAKVRQVLEARAPSQVQFLPVELSVERALPPITYWLVNTLRVLECYHPKLSKWKVLSVPSKTWWSFSKLVIDRSRVPENIAIFREVHCSTPIIIRTELRRALEVAGVTGAQFYPIDEA